ncbi:MAG: CinA family protein [Chloroflexi bacterium]|nr:MAG: CinA family protein [Chloroflexota bacterium]
MRALQQRAIKTKQTVATAESCTGGLLGAVLTAHGGASAFYRGGAIVYDNAAKTVLADVAPDLLHGHGAVSSVVAQALAAGARRRLSADIGLGITGIAGPGGATPGKPVGLVYVAVDSDRSSRVKKSQFSFDRDGNRRASVAVALELLAEALR